MMIILLKSIHVEQKTSIRYNTVKKTINIKNI